MGASFPAKNFQIYFSFLGQKIPFKNIFWPNLYKHCALDCNVAFYDSSRNANVPSRSKVDNVWHWARDDIIMTVMVFLNMFFESIKDNIRFIF